LLLARCYFAKKEKKEREEKTSTKWAVQQLDETMQLVFYSTKLCKIYTGLPMSHNSELEHH